ncbi:MAG TPA: family 31 glucosidase, partial [Lachnospiraceae bacterium]|nr:family 31 glucosidase [Lachnospiraceae bacterium]
MIFKEEKNALIASRQGEIIRIEAWGRDSVRIRSTMNHEFTGNVWALTEKPETSSTSVRFEKDTEGEKAFFSNGRIEVTINSCGVISIARDNKTILAERYRNYAGTLSKESRCLKYRGREFKGIPGGDFSLSLRFESTPYEKIFGMGQYQQPNLNL